MVGKTSIFKFLVIYGDGAFNVQSGETAIDVIVRDRNGVMALGTVGEDIR